MTNAFLERHVDERQTLQHLLVDGSPDSVRATHAEMRDRLRDILASEGARYHPDAVRVLQRAALALDIDSRESRPGRVRMSWMRLRNWAGVWFSSAGVGTATPWAETRSHQFPHNTDR